MKYPPLRNPSRSYIHPPSLRGARTRRGNLHHQTTTEIAMAGQTRGVICRNKFAPSPASQ